MAETVTWFVYILRCADNTYYTGIAKDLQARLDTHNSGSGAKYTKTRLPVKIVYQEKSENRSTASKREHAIKKLTRLEKQRLIDTPKRTIVRDDLSGAEIQGLLKMHLEDAYRNSPPESVHALDLDGLRTSDITFWSLWDGPYLMGCGALKMLDEYHGEIKSMRTHSDHLRKGVGATILTHIIEQARHYGCRRLSLETGSNTPYTPARALYARYGFVECGPFANYAIDDFSYYMNLDISPVVSPQN